MGDAYVLIVVAEYRNGDMFYDLDATDVEEVENNKGAAETLAATRVPNPGRQSSAPKGRIHRIKEFVNYIDSLEKACFSGGVEVVTELKAGDKNILVAVQLDALKTGTRNHKVNRIVSLYGKNKIKKLLGHNRLYWNKAKARIWTGGGGLQSSTAPYPKRASARKVLKPEDLVKYKDETFDFSGSIVNQDEQALAAEVVAAGQGFRANLATICFLHIRWTPLIKLSHKQSKRIWYIPSTGKMNWLI